MTFPPFRALPVIPAKAGIHPAPSPRGGGLGRGRKGIGQGGLSE